MPSLTPVLEVEDLKARRHGAIEKLVNTYADMLLAAALGLGFSKDSGEELVQETFAAFLAALDRFEERSHIKTFLFGIFYHKASDLRRRAEREQATDPIDEVFERRFGRDAMWTAPPQGPEDIMITREISEMIRACSEGLSIDQRAAFYLKEAEGETNSTICNILKVSTTNLRVLLFRARNKLRECLERKWGAR